MKKYQRNFTLPARIARSICENYIENGLVAPGAALPSLRALQALFAASTTTIAQALACLEAEGIVEKRPGRGCFVQPGGHVAAMARPSRTVGLVSYPASGHELMARLADGARRATQRFGCRLMFFAREGGYENERELVKQVFSGGCEAVIVVPITRQVSELHTDYLTHEFEEHPMVLVDTCLRDQGHVQVVMDNRSAGYGMTRLLLEEGHEYVAIAHYQGRQVVTFIPSLSERERGYLDAFRQVGRMPRSQDHLLLKHDEEWMDESGNPSSTMLELVRQWKNTPRRATAILASFDRIAVALLEAARREGVDVPGDLRIAGFDNLEMGRTVRPPFPTTNPDFGLAGEKAVELALQQLDGSITPPSTYIIPVPILPRHAT